MIPVVIAPVVSRYDLLERMVRSLTTTGRLIVVDNGRTGYWLPDGMRTGGTQEYIRPTTGLGYCGGINAGILQSPEAPWWLWVSNDIEFGDGDIAYIESMMYTTSEPRVITGGCTWGAMNRAVVDVVGLWDEHNFYPIYYDDNDFAYRCQLVGVEWIEYEGNITHGVGQGPSVTIQSSDAHRAANQVTFEMNHRTYLEKWGGEPRHEVFTTPWNTGYPVWYTKPNLTNRATAIKAWEKK